MKLAIVRIRGTVGRSPDARDTFTMLNLKTPNHCAIVEDSPSIQGMLKVIEPFVTWGPISEKLAKELSKKGKHFGLNPPKKGYGRKGVKKPFKLHGAYGDRGDKINDLLERMMNHAS